MLSSHFAMSSFCHDNTLFFASCIGDGVDKTSDCADTTQQKNLCHLMFHSYRSIAWFDDGHKNQQVSAIAPVFPRIAHSAASGCICLLCDMSDSWKLRLASVVWQYRTLPKPTLREKYKYHSLLFEELTDFFSFKCMGIFSDFERLSLISPIPLFLVNSN